MTGPLAELSGEQAAQARIRNLWDQRRYEAVLAAVDANINDFARSPELLHLGAMAAHNLEKTARAEYLYRRLMCLDPTTTTYRFLFKIERERGNWQAGARLLQYARVISPRSEIVASLIAHNRSAAPQGEARSVPPAPPPADPLAAGDDPANARPGGGLGIHRWLLAALSPPLLAVAGGATGVVVAFAQPWWWTLGAGVLGASAVLLLFEFYGFARLTGETGEVMSPARRLRQETNSYISQVTQGAGGGRRSFRRRTFASALTPHPYLAYVNKQARDPEHPFHPNNYGFFNRPFPYERDSACFHVLVSGGSVAAQFAQMSRDGPRYLEDALNRRFVPPKGDRFVVLNGALGGWHYPQQVGIAAMLASAVDAVVTLDGFNEAGPMLRDGVLIEMPGRKFLLSNPGLERGYERMVGDWLAGWVYELSLRYPFFRHSNYFCLVSQKLRQGILSAFDQGDDRNYAVRIFEMPRLGRERRWAYAVRRYADYQRFLHGACRQVGIQSAHFLQPIPGIGKRLTDVERGYTRPLSEGVIDLYRMMEDAMAAMAEEEGMPCVSLTGVFAARTDTIYADWPHCVLDRETGESEGYRLMAEAMAEELGRLWSLTERSAGASRAS